MRSSLFRLNAFALSRRLAAFFLLFSLFGITARGQNFSAQIINYNLEIPSWQTATFLNNGTSGVNGAYFTNYGTVQANGNFQVGTTNWAVFYQNGGTFNVSDYLSIARNSGSGTIQVNGGWLNAWNRPIIVGESGNGSIGINGGGVYAPNGTVLSGNAGSVGSLDLNSGILVTSQIYKWGGGTGSLNLNGGTLKATREEWNFISGLNSANIGSNGAEINNDGKGIGINQTLTGSGSGSVIFDGSNKTTLWQNNTYTGDTLIRGGVLNFQDSGSLYNNGTAAGNIIVSSGATLYFNKQDVFGNADTGSSSPVSITLNGGGINNGGVFNNLANLTMNGGNLNASGGSAYGWNAYELNNVTVGGSSASTITSNTLVNGNNNILLSRVRTTTFNVGSTGDATGDLKVSAKLTDGNGVVGSLTKTGTGKMVLSAANSFTGTTRVSAGTLMVDTGGSIAGSSATVDSGATLQVNGAAGVVTVTNGGMVQGSGSITNLTVSSNGLVKILSASTNSTGAWYTAGTINFNAGSKIDVTGQTLSQQPYVLIRGSSVTGTPIVQGATGFTVSNSATTVGLMPAVDTDGDGLTDYQESQLGTDPQKIDSNILLGVTWSAVYGFANGSFSDKSGNGNTLSAFTGSPGFVPDRSGSSSSAFQGSTGRILGRSGGLAGFNPANNQLSLSAWIKTTSAGNELLVSMGRSPSSFEGEWIWGISNGQLYFWDYQGSNGFPATFTSTTSVNNGEWRHVAFVRNGLTGTFYVDGVTAGSMTAAKNVTYTNSDLVIGGDYRDYKPANPSTGLFWTGQLDDLSISSTALTAAQIFLLSTGASVPGVETGPTNSISGLTQTSVNLMGGITNLGGTTVTSCGFYLNTNSPATNGVKYSAPGTSFGLGSFSSTITGLTPGTSYYYRAFGANSVGTSYGANEYSFATPSPSPFTYTNNGAGLTITGYTGTGGSVVIPGTIGTVAVTAIGQNAFQGKTNLTTVVIPNGVTTIGSYAFAACSMTAITLPNSLRSIEDHAFENNGNLTAVTIPEGVTTIGSTAFAGCRSMTTITLPNSLTTIGNYAFQGCGSLGSIIIPEGVTSLGGSAFESCSGLSSITLPNSLQQIGTGTFFFCTNLASITIPDSVLVIGENAFWNCHKLESVTIGSGVTALPRNAFSECLALTSVSLGANVKTLGDYAFNNCGKLKSITFPAGLESIGTSAFALCADLTTVTIPAGVSAIGIRAFKQCSKLATVYFQKNTPPTIYAEAFSGIATGAKGYYPATASTEWRGITAYNDLTLVHPDTESPVITLIGANPLEIYKSGTFSDPGATVTDNKDATRTITGTGTVNTATVGIYTLTYTTTDVAGNLAVPVTRTVNVVLNPSGDEDGDGLTNGAEMSGGTNPYQKDSDSDGVNDLVEVADNTNPTNPDSFNNLNRGLVAYYPFNGNAKDLSGSGNDGILLSPVLSTDRLGASNAAYTFNGTSDRIDLANSVALNMNNGVPFSMSAWIKTDFNDGQRVILGKAAGASGNTPALFVDNEGKLRFDNFFINEVHSSITVRTGTWTHVVVTYDGSTYRLYVNGVADGEKAFTGSNESGNSWTFSIGGSLNTSFPSGMFKGSIDEVQFWSRTLSPTEVAGVVQASSAPANRAPVIAGQSTTYDALAEFIAGPALQSANSRWQYLGGNVSALALLGNWKTSGNEIIQNQSQWDGNSGWLSNYPFVQRVNSASGPVSANTLVIHPSNLDEANRAVAIGWKNTTGQTVAANFNVNLRLPYGSANGIDYKLQRGLAGSSRYLSIRSGSLQAGGSVALASDALLEMQAGEMLYLIVDSKNNFEYDHTEVSAFTVTVAGGANLDAISEGVASANNPGTAVTVLTATSSDADSAALKGIAVTGVDTSHGIWEYTLNGGSVWNSLSGVNIASARLLKSDELHRVRFIPNVNFSGNAEIQYRAWDQTSGEDGALADLTAAGGGAWVLVAYGANASLGGFLTGPSGSFSSSARTGSAVLPGSLDILKNSMELAMTWTASGGSLPSGGIGSYTHGIAFALPNAAAMSFDGSASSPVIYYDGNSYNPLDSSFTVGSSSPDQSLVSVRTLVGSPGMPSQMYLRNKTFGAGYGSVYGLVMNDGSNAQLDYGSVPDSQTFKAVYLDHGAGAAQGQGLVMGGAGGAQNSYVPSTMAIWARLDSSQVLALSENNPVTGSGDYLLDGIGTTYVDLIDFDATGAFSAETATGTIRVLDTSAPVITLIGANPLEIYKGVTFSDPGASVTDNKDSTRNITGSGAVNTAAVGIYTLTYTATDVAGNLALPVTRTVSVLLNPSGDEDGDGLTNGAEILGGTSPYQKDSDNDGVNDSMEIADGTNPTNPDSFNNLNKGLVAYYPFNGNADDESGNGRNAANLGATSTTDRFGVANRAFLFDGQSNYMRVADASWFPTGRSEFTLSTWLFIPSVPANNDHKFILTVDAIEQWQLFVSGRTGYQSFEFYMGEARVGGVLQDWYDYSLGQGVQLGFGSWHQFALTRKNNPDGNDTVTWYFNGNQIHQVSTTLENQASLNGNGLTIGRRENGYGPWFGKLDEIRIYNRGLTATEVGQLYQTEADNLDTDGDGLTDAWEQGFGRYQVISGNFTWEQAKADAEARGGHLATITSESENSFIVQQLGAQTVSEKYFGGTDQQMEGVWKWVTGESWNYSKWSPGEPSDSGHIQNYTWFHPAIVRGNDWSWDDFFGSSTGVAFLPNSDVKGYILEFGYPTDPTKADTDGDGFDDKVESIAGKDPNDAAAFPDTQAPLITLIGANPLQIYKGATFSDPGATVTDNVDATRTITGSGTVNTTAVGIYALTYTATDAAGNLAVPVTRTVNVVNKATPTITGLPGFMSATGGTISGSGDFIIHTFRNVGSYTFQSMGSGTVEILVVAGGGGAGYDGGGGGGAGGVITNTVSVTAGTDYTVVVGGGGAAASGPTWEANGSPGSNSQFGSITAIGGAGGYNGHAEITATTTGGSGGGEGFNGGGPGSGTPGQGNRGGSNSLNYAGGGGGGAGEAGGNASGLNGGNGGKGIQSDISGVATWYGGGGAGGAWNGTGGTGGMGGGGNGGGARPATAGANGIANTGGGGGGNGYASSNNSGKGGSGIVIVRYRTKVLTYGQSIGEATLSGATASVLGSFAFANPSATPAVGSSSQSVIFTPSDTANYETVTTSVVVFVAKATPTILTPPTSTSIGYGQTLGSSTLSGGVANVPGTFAWTTPSTSPNAGTTAQGVTFTPSDTANYNTATTSVNVTVNKATPSITTTPTAAPIAYGQTLAFSTLSGGGASVTGSFAWTAPSTLPNAGTDSQSVTFNPTDTANYNTATASVNVTVNPALISSGFSHTLYLSAGASNVTAWGLNTDGRLGVGNTNSPVNWAQAVKGIPAGATIAQFSAGGTHSLILAGGQVYAAGSDRFGQLGQGGTNGVNKTGFTPVPMTSNTAVAVAAGGNHSLILTASGKVLAFGDNTYGQLARSNTIVSLGTLSELIFPLLTNRIVSVAAGADHNLALDENGGVWAWGRNDSGQLGKNTRTSAERVPVRIISSGAKAVAAGYAHSLVLMQNGTVQGFGKNTLGQAGQSSATTYAKVPTPISGLNGIRSISVGTDSSFAITESGQLYGWGYNSYGELLLGYASPISAPAIYGPTPSPICTNVSNVSGGGYSSLAVGAQGVIFGGRNDMGQSGNGPDPEQVVGDYFYETENLAISNLTMDLAGTTETLYDQVFVGNGAATLDGIVNLMFVGTYTGPVYGSTQTFDLIWARDGINLVSGYQLAFKQSGYLVESMVADKKVNGVNGKVLQATVRAVVTAADLVKAGDLAKPSLDGVESVSYGASSGVGIRTLSVSSGVEMIYSYERPTGGVSSGAQYFVNGITYRVEQVSILTNAWGDASVSGTTVTPLGNGRERVTLRVSSSGTAGYLRLTIETPQATGISTGVGNAVAN